MGDGAKSRAVARKEPVKAAPVKAAPVKKAAADKAAGHKAHDDRKPPAPSSMAPDQHAGAVADAGYGDLIAAARARMPPAKPKQAASNAKLQEVLEAFAKRVADTAGKDTGKRPGLIERALVENEWGAVVAASSIAGKLLGKDYEMSRTFLHHYLAADGSPLIYAPPQPVCDVIAKHFPNPGRYSNVSPYNWGNPDIRNGLGHFNLDVIDDGAARIYLITDRYAFPEFDDHHKAVRHGFQIGKLTDEQAKTLNHEIARFGEYKREHGPPERFELIKTEKSGEYTLFVPQPLLADHGVDFESIGIFQVDKPAHRK